MSSFQPQIELQGGAENLPFAAIMADLVRTNLSDHPKKRADFAKMRGRVALVAEDVDLAITLYFQAGRLSIYPGLFGIPDVVVRGDSTGLLDLSRLPPHPRLSFLPDARSDVARSLVEALRAKKLRLYGFLGNLGLGLRFARVLSIY